MTASIAVPASYDLPTIASTAGQPDPEARWYESGTLYVVGVDQADLEAALVAYDSQSVLRARAAARIAARRYQAETRGIVINGMPIDTGRDSQGLIAGAALAAVIDPQYTVRWKAAHGQFVELTAQQVIGVATAVREHVQACFDREAELLAELDAGTFADGMLEEGWPNG